jgi:spoIIIJ-associated protein
MGTSNTPAPARSLKSFLEPIESLLRQIIQHGRLELSFAVREDEPGGEELEAPEITVDFSGPDSSLLLEKNAAFLNALEYVVLRAARLDEAYFGRITFDCQEWRRLRAEELKLTAQMAAERVIETGDPFPLNPMSARERRIVHMALRECPQVRTMSEGVGIERKVVIHPATSPPRRK